MVGMKPKAIRETLVESGLEPPSIIQLRNFLITMKTEKFGKTSISLGELESWCKESSQIPEDEDVPYIVSYFAKTEEEPITFGFFASTKRLLGHAKDAKIVHADATYKLIWQGYPVLVVGTSDADQHFHHFGMGVCMNEKTADFEFIFEALQKGVESVFQSEMHPEVLVADAAHSIQNAFQSVFATGEQTVMCWAHMHRNISKKIISLVKKENRGTILSDIETIQVLPSPELFHQAVELFFAKWENKEKSFVSYFKKEWINSNSNWYEGYRHFTPSTNNCLESCNNVIKKENTFRERHPLSRFKMIALKTVARWSNSYKNGLKSIITTPTIHLARFTSAYQWVKSKKEVVVRTETEDLKAYFIPAGKKTSLTEDEIQTHLDNTSATTFDNFVKNQFEVWTVKINKDQWLEARCSCPFFFKNYSCKHTVGIAIRTGLVKPPLEVRGPPMEQKRKRGRPAKAGTALSFDLPT